MIDDSRNIVPVSCPRCGARLAGSFSSPAASLHCAGCEAVFQAELFPALFRGMDPVELGESLHRKEEAGCFYHPGKRAVVVCEICGRFLCALCNISLAGQNLCPTCVELGRKREQLTDLVTYRTLYDQIALSLATIPLLFIFPTPLTAPITLYMIVHHWKSPSSLLPRSRFRFILAGLLASLQVICWMLVFMSPRGGIFKAMFG